MATEVEVVVNNFPLFREEFAQALDEAMVVASERVREYAIDRCPVGTPESTGIPGYKGGSLKSTIRTEKKSETETDVMAGGIEGLYKFVSYAGYVELGTRKMAAKPFLKPAAEDHLSELQAIFNRAFEG